MRYLLECNRPLGGILRLFPFAQHLARAKHEVFIRCPEEYRSLFGLIDYAHWIAPAAVPTGGPVREISMQIFPGLLQRYRTENPPRRYADFLAALEPELFRGVRREIILTSVPPIGPILAKYGLPAQFDLVCPAPSIEPNAPIDFGTFESWLCDGLRLPGPCYYLAGQGWRPNRLHVCVHDLAELAALIRHARNFASVTAGPALLAAARLGAEPLRESWHYVVPTAPRDRFQDDILAKGQVRWEVNAGAPVPSIIPLRKA